MSDEAERLQRQWAQDYEDPPTQLEWETDVRLTCWDDCAAVHEKDDEDTKVESDMVINLMEAR